MRIMEDIDMMNKDKCRKWHGTYVFLGVRVLTTERPHFFWVFITHRNEYFAPKNQGLVVEVFLKVLSYSLSILLEGMASVQ